MVKKPAISALGLLILALLVAGCSQKLQNAPAPNAAEEQITDTGAISIKSIPASAQAYANGELKGNTPLELDNIPVGKYKITIKKEGYTDFEKSVSLKVGRIEEIEAVLNEMPAPVQMAVEENKTAVQIKQHQETAAANVSVTSKFNVAVVNKSFIVYYDFRNGLFTETTSGSPDVFSQNYETYLYFTAISPVKIGIINKNLKDITKWDCMIVGSTIGNLYPGETLCVKTADGHIVAIGGIWKTAPSELEWQILS